MKNGKRILEVRINWEADKDPDTSYLEEGDERYRTFHAGLWDFCGVYATAQIAIPTTEGNAILQKVHSGGLWGIESDSDKSYMQGLEGEQLTELKAQLKELGFSSRAISTAFKNVIR
jgi:hypothetical protein